MTRFSKRVTVIAGAFCGVCACCAFSLLVLVSCYALQPLPDVLPGGLLPLFEVATGFAWAENMVCVRRNESLDPARAASLFVTDSQRGDLLRIDWVGRASGHYSQPMLHPASADFALMAGAAWNSRTGELFVLANVRPSARERERCALLSLEPFAPPGRPPAETYAVVAQLERRCLGDGLAVHERTGLVYAASQGAFLPGMGAVYEIDPRVGSVRAIISGAFGTDGAFIDQARSLLYVSETPSPSHSVLVYDLAERRLAGRIHPRGVSALDDFTLSADGRTLIAADFLGNSGVAFSTGAGGADGHGGRLAWARSRTELASALVSGATVPTSVRRGCSADPTSGFSDELLFISEGGGLSDLASDRRVLAFALPPSGMGARLVGETPAHGLRPLGARSERRRARSSLRQRQRGQSQSSESERSEV